MRFMRVQQAVEIIQAEYERTPGLRVTFWQAQRLWNLSSELCERALTALIGDKFLVPAPDGAYIRRAAQDMSGVEVTATRQEPDSVVHAPVPAEAS